MSITTKTMAALACFGILLSCAPTIAAEPSTCVQANTVSTEVCVPAKTKPRIALALGGGGIRGAAHVGVLKVFEREGIPIDCITGTSMGAIIGGMYSAGVPLQTIEYKLRKNEIAHAYAPFWVRNPVLNKIALAMATMSHAPGMVNAKRFASYMDRQVGGARIEGLQKQFSAVCTDLQDGRACSMTTGNLGDAISISAALPPVVKPVYTPKGSYVDGGLAANLPINAAKEFGPEVIIGVSVDEQIGVCTPKNTHTMKGVADRMAGIALSTIDHFHGLGADTVITPDVSDIALLSKKRADIAKAIDAGEAAAVAAMPTIKKILQDKGVLNMNANAGPVIERPEVLGAR